VRRTRCPATSRCCAPAAPTIRTISFKRAGVDLATPAPYQALVARMNAIMDEIEAILARRPRPVS
jgi:hypothetical protein